MIHDCVYLQGIQNDLKPVRTPLNIFLRGNYSKYLTRSMHLLSRMNVMLDFILKLPVKLRGTRNK